MFLRALSVISLFFCCIILYPQNKDATKYANLIDSVQLRSDLNQLASNEYKGRKTGTPGEKLGAFYIAYQLRKADIKPAWDSTYFQTISMYKQIYTPKKFQLKDTCYMNAYTYFNQYGQAPTLKGNEICFIGYGVHNDTYDELKAVGDISGKIVMMFSGEPLDKSGVSYAGNNQYGSYYWQNKIKTMNPQAIIHIAYENNTYYDNSTGGQSSLLYLDEKSKDIPVVTINEALANKLLASTRKTVKQIRYEVEKNGKPQSVTIKEPFEIGGDVKYELSGSSNVIGFIEGEDLKNEYIVLSAHYDHLGKTYGGDIYNGADDNASGVSAVLEIARAFATAKKEGKGPRRSIIFLFSTAEELGLYGSDYYASHPIFPLQDTKACINLDMLGRMSADYEDKTGNYIYLVSDEKKSGMLPDICQQTGKVLNMTVDMSFQSPYDKESFFERSDQYNFALKNIPSVMITSGMHEDYHRLTDDTERIHFTALEERTKLAFLLAWRVAND